MGVEDDPGVVGPRQFYGQGEGCDIIGYDKVEIQTMEFGQGMTGRPVYPVGLFMGTPSPVVKPQGQSLWLLVISSWLNLVVNFVALIYLDLSP